MWRLMVLAAYLTPVHFFLVPAAPSMRPLAATATLPRAARLPAAVRMQDEDPYRTLGISEDAGYDAINDAYDELSERYAGDAGMIKKLDAAKDKVVNNMLAKRMAGAAASSCCAGSLPRPQRIAHRRLLPYYYLRSTTAVEHSYNTLYCLICLLCEPHPCTCT